MEPRKRDRKFRRYQLITELRVFDAMEADQLGLVQDITVEGLGLRLLRPVDLGAIVAMVVELPVDIQGTRKLALQGRCTWCAPASNPDIHEAGFVLLDPLPDATEIIEELIRRFAR